MKIYWTNINKIIDETSDVKTYLLDLPEGFTWEEGSYTHMGLEGFNAGDKPNRNLIRHMSISTLPEENAIGITTRIREQCSEFKATLRDLTVGDKVAIFKTRSNVPLKRDKKPIYLLSSGVGLATFRPLVIEYLKDQTGITHIHSLNIDSSNEFLFPNLFKTDESKSFTTQFVDNRQDYYDELQKLTRNKGAYFYLVGSDEFLIHNIKILREHDIDISHILLDKNERQLPNFLPEKLHV